MQQLFERTNLGCPEKQVRFKQKGGTDGLTPGPYVRRTLVFWKEEWN